jgi:type II secretory pathway pseudopilin PulG
MRDHLPFDQTARHMGRPCAHHAKPDPSRTATQSPCLRQQATRMRLRHAAGFTYVALMLLLAIISLSATATVQVADLARRRAAENELLYVGQQYVKAFLEYELYTPEGNGNRAPSRLEDLLRDPRQPGVRRYIRQLYPDPITGKLDWQLIRAPGGGIMGIQSASCATTIRQSFPNGDLMYLDGRKRYCDWTFAYVMVCGANCRDSERPEHD